MTDDVTHEDLLKQILGLRASVAKYKRRAELAVTRADQAEVRMRTAERLLALHEQRMTNVRHRVHALHAEVSGEIR